MDRLFEKNSLVALKEKADLIKWQTSDQYIIY